MNARLVQCFFAVVALSLARAGQLQVDSQYRLRLTDVNQRELSTGDGRVDLIVIVTRANQHDARAVGDHVPRQYYGDPRFRLITVVNFNGFPSALQRIARGWVRHRVELEAERLEPIYRAKGMTRDPHQDVFVVADFDGKTLGEFGVAPDEQKSSTLVFGRDGRLLARWNKVPPAEDLAAVLKRAATQ